MSLFQPLWQPAETTAASIPNTPAGSIAATTVQAALNELDVEKLAASGGTLTNYSETLYSPAAITAATLTIDLANGNVQRFTLNPSGASTAITLPSDPGAIAKSFVLLLENATGKAHTWAASPAIKWVSETDSDTVPTPAAVTYISVYSFIWDDNDAGTGRWLGWLSGKETS